MGLLIAGLAATGIVGGVVLVVRSMLRGASSDQTRRLATAPYEGLRLPTNSVDLDGRAPRDPMFDLDAQIQREHIPGGGA